MLVTGGSGFLGQHLVRGPASHDWEIVAPASRLMDITDRNATIETITDRRPDVVVHLAYRKDDRRAIVDGSRNVAEAAAAAGSRLVHMSTDVVFAGRATPYVESDPPDPIIEYGRNKADAEAAVLETVPGAVVIRTSLLYGTDDPAPFQTELTTGLRSGRSPMAFFTDEFRCPAHAADVAAAVVRVASQPDLAGILHVAGPESVSRLDFATALAAFAGVGHVPLPATTIRESGMERAGTVVLDTSLAASLGIVCRSLSALATEKPSA